MKPKMKKLAAEYPNISFVVTDAEKFPESRNLATVDNLPTFATFKGGTFVNQVQTNKFEVLKTLVDEIASLNILINSFKTMMKIISLKRLKL